MSDFKKVVSGIFFAVFLFVGYEAYAIYEARTETADIFSSISTSGKIAIQLEDLSEERVQSLLSVVDPDFYKHNGLDFKTTGAGMTTITQIITQSLYLDKFNPGFERIEQSLIAFFAVTPTISKDEQLTVFINTVDLGVLDGQSIRGFSDASRAYYDKPLKELANDEYLSIVAMIIGPRTFNIKQHPMKNHERVTLIKKLLSGEYVPDGNGDVFYGQKL